MKKKLSTVAGVTLIEILIGILISVVMMAAMFTSYTVVNNSYTQVADRAKISTAGRDVIGMLLRDIRLAGFKYHNDNIATSNEHAPIIITKSNNFAQSCDKIEIVYGTIAGKPKGNPPTYTYERYKITYECKKSKILNKSAPPLSGNKYPPIDAFAIYKSKVKWNTTSKNWDDGGTDNNPKTYGPSLVTDYISDLVFNAIDDKGLLIKPPPNTTNSTKDKLYKIKTIDIALTVRSTKDFYRTSKIREILAMTDASRNIKKTDKFLRDTIVVTAHARNIGL